MFTNLLTSPSPDRPRDRWIVSNQFWTSSGVTAGIDMAAAFIRYFVALHMPPDEARAMGDKVLGILEVSYVVLSPIQVKLINTASRHRMRINGRGITG